VLIPSLPFAAGAIGVAASAVDGGLSDPEIWFLATVILLVVARQILALVENITFWRQLAAKVEARDAAVRRSEARFRSLVQNSSDLITVIAPDGSIGYQSPSIRNVLGYEPDDLTGPAPPLDLVHPQDVPKVVAMARELEDAPGAARQIECQVQHRDGQWRDVEVIATNQTQDPAVAAYVVNTREITERKERQQLTHRAFHDPLTNLANRALFADRLEHALDRRASRGRPLAVIFLDLDDFKDVNDSLGHGIGDEVLAAVAQRLRECARAEDTVARLGGDEFAILVEEIEDMVRVRSVAERIRDALGPPLLVAGNEVLVRCSIGIAASPSGGESAEELLRNADIAMYTAKANGKGVHQVFESSMQAALVDRLGLENDLRGAVERDEFELLYQPIVTLGSGRVCGVEALLRWRHPQRGLLAPSRFISLSESTGTINEIGQWVLDNACAEGHRWASRIGADDFFLAINLSARQLLDPRITERVGEALRRSGLGADQLVMEITESVLVEQPTAMTSLNKLQDMGLQLALDDFGTGHSALHYLPRLPIDILKIDRGFIEGVADDGRQAAVVEAIIAMSRKVSITPVAEGVERLDQADALLEMGCPLAQGYHFARPGPPRRIDRLLSSNGFESVRSTGPREVLAGT
jgi:diguanylate cyclase (GGDEF)-like protein/PAS domain S-box-containing protein